MTSADRRHLSQPPAAVTSDKGRPDERLRDLRCGRLTGLTTAHESIHAQAAHPSTAVSDRGVSPRMVKGRSKLRLAQRVASVVSCRPARCKAPTAWLTSSTVT